MRCEKLREDVEWIYKAISENFKRDHSSPAPVLTSSERIQNWVRIPGIPARRMSEKKKFWLHLMPHKRRAMKNDVCQWSRSFLVLPALSEGPGLQASPPGPPLEPPSSLPIFQQPRLVWRHSTQRGGGGGGRALWGMRGIQDSTGIHSLPESLHTGGNPHIYFQWREIELLSVTCVESFVGGWGVASVRLRAHRRRVHSACVAHVTHHVTHHVTQRSR